MDHGKLIAVRMEEARDARGISVAELARRASIDRKRLWYILDGQRQMRADEFVRLCAVMGLDMKFFLTPELREELAWRRQKTIEDYGTGLCGLPTLREKGDVSQKPERVRSGTVKNLAHFSDSLISPPSGAATPPAESRPDSASSPTRSRPRT